MGELQTARLATLAALTERRPGLGRTALMKLCYFLQSVRQVPLGYKFTLYSYGPFDSSVLSDLSTAEALGGIDSSTVFYPSGYGYEFVPAARSQAIKDLARDFLENHDADIDWVIVQFGHLGSADLELLSTIVYVDQEASRADDRLTEDVLIQSVREIKPRFTESYVREKAANLISLGVLKTIRPRKSKPYVGSSRKTHV